MKQELETRGPDTLKQRYSGDHPLSNGLLADATLLGFPVNRYIPLWTRGIRTAYKWRQSVKSSEAGLAEHQ